MRGRKFWIKSLGYGARGSQLPDRWDSVKEVNLRRSLTFPVRPGIRPGDGIAMYAAGTGIVFAAAEATSFPYLHDQSNWPWRVDIKLVVAKNHVHEGVPLDALAVDGREHNVRIRRRSHVSLTEREFEAAVEAIRNA